MDLIQRHWQFIVSLVSIVLVDLTLSGDNAVVIAAAAKSLPPPAAEARDDRGSRLRRDRVGDRDFISRRDCCT